MRTIIFIFGLMVVAQTLGEIIDINEGLSRSFNNERNNTENIRWTTWVDTIPEDAVYVGDDLDNEPIYVARAIHNGALLPGKAKPTVGKMYVGSNWSEYQKQQFQILSGKNLTWESAAFGNVPYNAVHGGRSATGENLYIGRIFVNGVLTSGRVQPSLRNAYVPFGGREYHSSFYDVLVEEY